MSRAFFEPDGAGFVASALTRGPWRVGIDTALYDERGALGRAAQTLLVGER